MAAHNLPLTIGATNSIHQNIIDGKMSYHLSHPVFHSDSDGTHDIFIWKSIPYRYLFDSTGSNLKSITRSGEAREISIIRDSHGYHLEHLPDEFPVGILAIQQDFQASITACKFLQVSLGTTSDDTILERLRLELSQGPLLADIPDSTVEIILDITIVVRVAEALVLWTLTMQYYRGPSEASRNWSRCLGLCTEDSHRYLEVDPIIISPFSHHMPPHTTPSPPMPAPAPAGSVALIQVPQSQILASHIASPLPIKSPIKAPIKALFKAPIKALFKAPRPRTPVIFLRLHSQFQRNLNHAVPTTH
ncbi:hypothetical protein BGX24_008149 [Mortierella sp. AD032]|nr:hypothetical protein BGX24_008149 [Mortierella sp. AD032]